jgi:hypothetical protein
MQRVGKEKKKKRKKKFKAQNYWQTTAYKLQQHKIFSQYK